MPVCKMAVSSLLDVDDDTVVPFEDLRLDPSSTELE